MWITPPPPLWLFSNPNPIQMRGVHTMPRFRFLFFLNKFLSIYLTYLSTSLQERTYGNCISLSTLKRKAFLESERWPKLNTCDQYFQVIPFLIQFGIDFSITKKHNSPRFLIKSGAHTMPQYFGSSSRLFISLKLLNWLSN